MPGEISTAPGGGLDDCPVIACQDPGSHPLTQGDHSPRLSSYHVPASTGSSSRGLSKVPPASSQMTHSKVSSLRLRTPNKMAYGNNGVHVMVEPGREEGAAATVDRPGRTARGAIPPGVRLFKG